MRSFYIWLSLAVTWLGSPLAALPVLEPLGAGVNCAGTDGDIIRGQDTIDGEVIRTRRGTTEFDIVSTRVPARIGVSFGLAFRVTSNPLFLPLTARVSHPPMGAKGVTQQTWSLEHRAGASVIAGYGIEDTFEFVAGRWVFEILSADRVLLVQDFDMFIPDGSGSAICQPS